jgi:hypothetical protein
MEKCKSCGANIIFGLTDRGRRMPVDIKPHPDGNILLVKAEGLMVKAVVIKEEGRAKYAGGLHLSHFTSCKQAKQWRKSDADKA